MLIVIALNMGKTKVNWILNKYLLRYTNIGRLIKEWLVN